MPVAATQASVHVLSNLTAGTVTGTIDLFAATLGVQSPVSVLRLPQMSATAGKQTWGNLPGAALSLAIAEAASSAGRFTLLLTADSQAADRLEQELRFFAPDLPVLPFPIGKPCPTTCSRRTRTSFPSASPASTACPS